jgi:hypothetical protein
VVGVEESQAPVVVFPNLAKLMRFHNLQLEVDLEEGEEVSHEPAQGDFAEAEAVARSYVTALVATLVEAAVYTVVGYP